MENIEFVPAGGGPESPPQTNHMKTDFLLNNPWTLSDASGHALAEGSVPCSVYSLLLDAGKMKDPFFRENELTALKLADQDFVFSTDFCPDAGLLARECIRLRFEGIDTLADISLNGTRLGRTDNFFRIWEYDVKGLLHEGKNHLEVHIQSPTKFITAAAEAGRDTGMVGSDDAMPGFWYLRKPHCMFGWDWGPRLPDEGIWKDVHLTGWDTARISDVRILQKHADGRVWVKVQVQAETADGRKVSVPGFPGTAASHLSRDTVSGGNTGELSAAIPGPAGTAVPGTLGAAVSGASDTAISADDIPSGAACDWYVRPDDRWDYTDAPAEGIAARIFLIAPDGETTLPLTAGGYTEVPDPKLWWPNGLGEQPLYTVQAELVACPCEAAGAAVLDRTSRRIGLRTLTVRREKDAWGESFAHECNGQAFFAMGADYIPEDNVFPRITPERTRKLLKTCRDCHFNVIRVWGGGAYPQDWFYDLCDEYGIVVWQDFMFACADYPLTAAFEANITQEIRENVRRLRHHASLGLWCGNNEMEMFTADRTGKGCEIIRANYIKQNEYIIPHILQEEDPNTFYWPSSPSSGGSFRDPNSPDAGDVHNWDIWHGSAPFTDYRKHMFRYLSEFGFQSFPAMRTIEQFTAPEDRNIFSRVMERHQRNGNANGKILTYLSRTYLYPSSLELLVYASQLMQADAIRYGVEHFRRNRTDNRCMGAIYWQLNDIWPVASWASIDYYGRWKALQYSAKRFFAPVMLSCEENSEIENRTSVVQLPSPNISTARLCVTNETWNTFRGTVAWELRAADSRILQSGSAEITVPAFSAVWLDRMDFSDTDFLSNHLTYRLTADGSVISAGSALFTAPKHYRFADPKLTVSQDGDTLTVTSQAYARGVEIYSPDSDFVLSDNFFDMEKGSRSVQVTEGTPKTLRVRSTWDIR